MGEGKIYLSFLQGFDLLLVPPLGITQSELFDKEVQVMEFLGSSSESPEKGKEG